MRSDVQEGARFPDYQLPDHDGIERRLSELQGANPMLVHLARGGFDPKEHRFLRHLADTYPDFRAAYTRVVVISTDGQLEINEFRDSVAQIRQACELRIELLVLGLLALGADLGQGVLKCLPLPTQFRDAFGDQLRFDPLLQRLDLGPDLAVELGDLLAQPGA
jgi:AhpC/TSA family